MKFIKDKEGYACGIFVGFSNHEGTRKKDFAINGKVILNDDGEVKYPAGGKFNYVRADFKIPVIDDYGVKKAYTKGVIINEKFMDKEQPTIKYKLYQLAGIPTPFDDLDESDLGDGMDILEKSIKPSDEPSEEDDALAGIEDCEEVDAETEVENTPEYQIKLEPFIKKLKLKFKLVDKTSDSGAKYSEIDVKSIIPYKPVAK